MNIRINDQKMELAGTRALGVREYEAHRNVIPVNGSWLVADENEFGIVRGELYEKAEGDAGSACLRPVLMIPGLENAVGYGTTVRINGQERFRAVCIGKDAAIGDLVFTVLKPGIAIADSPIGATTFFRRGQDEEGHRLDVQFEIENWFEEIK